jgi:hypothetical protein
MVNRNVILIPLFPSFPLYVSTQSICGPPDYELVKETSGTLTLFATFESVLLRFIAQGGSVNLC